MNNWIVKHILNEIFFLSHEMIDNNIYLLYVVIYLEVKMYRFSEDTPCRIEKSSLSFFPIYIFSLLTSSWKLSKMFSNMRDEIYRIKNGNLTLDFASFCLYDKLFYDSTVNHYLT